MNDVLTVEAETVETEDSVTEASVDVTQEFPKEYEWIQSGEKAFRLTSTGKTLIESIETTLNILLSSIKSLDDFKQLLDDFETNGKQSVTEFSIITANPVYNSQYKTHLVLHKYINSSGEECSEYSDYRQFLSLQTLRDILKSVEVQFPQQTKQTVSVSDNDIVNYRGKKYRIQDEKLVLLEYTVNEFGRIVTPEGTEMTINEICELLNKLS